MKTPFYYWFSAVFSAIVISSSNLLQTDLAGDLTKNYFGLFILFIFAVSSGILLCLTFEFRFSFILLLCEWLIISLVSLLILYFKPDFFFLSKENLTISVGLSQAGKIVFAALFSFFGLILWSYYHSKKEIIRLKEKIFLIEKNIIDTKAEAELRKREALINAQEIIFDAKKKVEELERRKIDLETKLREFLQTELAVLERHDKFLKSE